MLDNKTRAHDLTISILNNILNPSLLRYRADLIFESDIQIDVFAEYVRLYEQVLTAFNKKYPEAV